MRRRGIWPVLAAVVILALGFLALKGWAEKRVALENADRIRSERESVEAQVDSLTAARDSAEAEAERERARADYANARARRDSVRLDRIEREEEARARALEASLAGLTDHSDAIADTLRPLLPDPLRLAFDRYVAARDTEADTLRALVASRDRLLVSTRQALDSEREARLRLTGLVEQLSEQIGQEQAIQRSLREALTLANEESDELRKAVGFGFWRTLRLVACASGGAALGQAVSEDTKVGAAVGASAGVIGCRVF